MKPCVCTLLAGIILVAAPTGFGEVDLRWIELDDVNGVPDLVLVRFNRIVYVAPAPVLDIGTSNGGDVLAANTPENRGRLGILADGSLEPGSPFTRFLLEKGRNLYVNPRWITHVSMKEGTFHLHRSSSPCGLEVPDVPFNRTSLRRSSAFRVMDTVDNGPIGVNIDSIEGLWLRPSQPQLADLGLRLSRCESPPNELPYFRLADTQRNRRALGICPLGEAQ